MKTYKGFNKDMICRGFQYEEGKEYTTNKAEVCKTGFHACEYPLDCLFYYSPSNSVYHEVEQSGDFSRNEFDTKIASTKIKIGARLSVAKLVEAAIEYTKKRIRPEDNKYESYGDSSTMEYKWASSVMEDYGASFVDGYKCASSATGNCSASSAMGYKSASSATGNYSASSATGDYGASSTTGYKCVSSATGNHGASSTTGYYSSSSATGNHGASSTTGDYSSSSVEGNCGASSTTGYNSASEALNPTSVAVAWGYCGKAKGVLGSHLVLADWVCNEGKFVERDAWTFKGAKMIQIDGLNYKPNTWYTMKNGEVVEVGE